MTDWSRKATPTSPHLFNDGNDTDIKFIENSLSKNKYSMFIRKISPEFPDEILKKYIYEYSKDEDNNLQINKPFFIINITNISNLSNIPKTLKNLFFFICIIYFLYCIKN